MKYSKGWCSSLSFDCTVDACGDSDKQVQGILFQDLDMKKCVKA